MNTYKVKNLPNYEITEKYTIIRECNNEYWYHSSWNDLFRASIVCQELGNGRIIETETIKK